MNYAHNDLIDIGRKWLMNPYSNGSKDYGHSACSVILSELCAHTRYGEIPDILGFNNNVSRSILIECKISRSDFYADLKKQHRHPALELGIGSQRWYLAPVGIIPIDKVPEKWGLLEVANNKIQVIKKCLLQERDFQSEINMLVSTMRRLNVLPDDHIGINKYTQLTGSFSNSKKKATFYIQEEKTK